MSQILIVDDQAENRQFLMTLLGYGGHRLFEASNGTEALEIVRSQRPDLAIVDLLMPAMDGYEFARRVRSEPLIAATPIIFHSAAYDENEVRPLANACGVSQFLSKPAEAEEVLRAVDDALGKNGPDVLPTEAFQQFDLEHRRLVTRKLLQKVRELERQNMELRRSNQELDDFAYIASHDLKEPLRGIHNYAVFLAEDYAALLDDEGRDKLGTLVRLTQRMEVLINALLETSHVGRLDFAIQETDLNRLVSEVVDSLKISLKQAEIEVRIPEKLPTLDCDRVRVGEVFQNLITNAIKYNDKPGKWIEIGAVAAIPPAEAPLDDGPSAAEPPAVAIYVRDNGIGIRKKHFASIFRIFKRLNARDEFGGGTGVGLTIARKIVERHGGRLWVESTYGEGSSFYFTLAADRKGMS